MLRCFEVASLLATGCYNCAIERTARPWTHLQHYGPVVMVITVPTAPYLLWRPKHCIQRSSLVTSIPVFHHSAQTLTQLSRLPTLTSFYEDTIQRQHTPPHTQTVATGL